MIANQLAKEHLEIKDDIKWILKKVKLSGLLMFLFEIYRDKALYLQEGLEAEECARIAVKFHNLAKKYNPLG